uniref:Putative ovule protein n=1 Tax=Solanum chacoense TaxID=4108 RepID=A0A0V0GR73_SOLCH
MMKMNAAIKDATTAPLTRWQKSPNCWHIATHCVVELPLCAKYTMAAAAAAAAVVNATITVSRIKSTSLAPTR